MFDHTHRVTFTCAKCEARHEAEGTAAACLQLAAELVSEGAYRVMIRTIKVADEDDQMDLLHETDIEEMPQA